jgi:hypothetical protein
VQVAPNLRQESCLELRFEEVTAAAHTFVAQRAEKRMKDLKNCMAGEDLFALLGIDSERVGGN